MSYDELIALATKFDSREPKSPFVFDVVASKLAARSEIELVFANGRQQKEIEEAISGKAVGTLVR